MNIFSSGILTLNSDCGLRAAKTDAIGKDEHWSGDALYSHLCLLERLGPRAMSMLNVGFRESFLKVR